MHAPDMLQAKGVCSLLVKQQATAQKEEMEHQVEIQLSYY